MYAAISKAVVASAALTISPPHSKAQEPNHSPGSQTEETEDLSEVLDNSETIRPAQRVGIPAGVGTSPYIPSQTPTAVPPPTNPVSSQTLKTSSADRKASVNECLSIAVFRDFQASGNVEIRVWVNSDGRAVSTEILATNVAAHVGFGSCLEENIRTWKFEDVTEFSIPTLEQVGVPDEQTEGPSARTSGPPSNTHGARYFDRTFVLAEGAEQATGDWQRTESHQRWPTDKGSGPMQPTDPKLEYAYRLGTYRPPRKRHPGRGAFILGLVVTGVGVTAVPLGIINDEKQLIYAGLITTAGGLGLGSIGLIVSAKARRKKTQGKRTKAKLTHLEVVPQRSGLSMGATWNF